MKKSLYVAAVLLLALIAYYLGTLNKDAVRTTGLCQQANEHCVSVSIYQATGGAWKIEVDNPVVHIRGQQHVIFWRINNTGTQKYAFPDDGIHFKSDEGKKEFRCQRMASDPGVFRCTDPNEIKGRFEYGITVTGSPEVPTLDPWVLND